MTVETRCHWSDLPADQCAHCHGHASDVEHAALVEPVTPPARVVWSTKAPRATQDAPREPRKTPKAPEPTRTANGSQAECACGRPTRDQAVLCDDCTEQLERALGDVGAVVADLEVTLTRQHSAPIVATAPSASTGLPWHEKAAEATRNLHGLLVLWVRLCDEESVGTGPTDLPADNPAALAGWLLHRVPGLARHDAAAEALDEITDAVAECERIIFWKRKNRDYLGPCGQPVHDEDGDLLLDSCPGDVYAEHDAQVGTCDDCGQGVTVVIRKAEMNRLIDDRLCTAAELARLAVILGLDAPRDRVRKQIHYWHRHKRIAQRGTATECAKGETVEVPTFRYGEVRVMLYQEFARDTA